jgi:predicted nucleic acid-binding protein
VTLLVDTSVWSLALRRDGQRREPEVLALMEALDGSDFVVTTGLVLQEILQGFSGPKTASAIVERFSALTLVEPTRSDYIAAASLRNTCRRGGIQIGTVDALIAQLCITNELTLLTTDRDFQHAGRHCKLDLWSVERAGRPR